jgi:hypothetical protein
MSDPSNALQPKIDSLTFRLVNEPDRHHSIVEEELLSVVVDLFNLHSQLTGRVAQLEDSLKSVRTHLAQVATKLG